MPFLGCLNEEWTGEEKVQHNKEKGGREAELDSAKIQEEIGRQAKQQQEDQKKEERDRKKRENEINRRQRERDEM